MNERTVPSIFSEPRRRARVLRSRTRRLADQNAACFIADDMAQDVIERLGFVRHTPERSVIIGHCPSELIGHLENGGGHVRLAETVDPAEPIGDQEFEFVAAFGQLDAVNDLPGALIHIRNALAPGGLAIVSFVGGASLPKLRSAMLAADGDRPAARIHPMVDPRAAPQLLQRAGWKDPVVDTHMLTVRYSSLDTLIADLRDQGLASALSDAAPPLGKAAMQRARDAFRDLADPDGKVSETFEIITLTGRRSMAGT